MMAPQASWHPVAAKVQAAMGKAAFSMLSYDRFGQGITAKRDPTTAATEFGSDLDEVVRDLSSIIQQIGPTSQLLLIGNSIGCAIARHYTAQTPGRVAGLILLDSIIANSDFADDMFPSPDAADLPLDRAELLRARQIIHKMFSPDLPSAQGFDRRNMRTLMPHADKPVLEGVGGPPLISVLAHDPEHFAQDSLMRIAMPKAATRYMQDRWDRYNEGVIQVGEGGRVKVVEGAGHFIQVDKPDVVADEIVDMLTQLGW
jgi:pimeloyl-ACP methyl ester carboxylesterase